METTRQIFVDRQEFDYPIGIKIIKAKFGSYKAFAESKNTYFSEAAAEQMQKDIDNSEKITVREALSIRNLEARRVCFRYIGIDKIFAELKPELADKQTIRKSTRVNKEGELEAFDDTYELYRVKGESLNGESVDTWRRVQDFFILRCSCTSTGREYLIYISDIWGNSRKPDAIEAVAWTIQVEVPEKDVEKIVRAGDCIMVKPKEGYTKCALRHITKQEYLTKLVAES